MIAKRPNNLLMRIACVASIYLCSSNCFGQARATVPGQEAIFDGQSVTIDYNEDRGRKGTLGAPINSIDVAGARFSPSAFPHPSISLTCKGEVKCFGGTVRYTGLVVASPGESRAADNSSSDYADIECSSVGECEAFLAALRRAVARDSQGTPRSAQPAAGQPRQTQPKPSQTAQESTPPAQSPAQPRAQPPASERVPGADGFRDVLDGIGWKKGSGTEALDDLLKQTKPTTEPPRRPSEQPTFAAFAQSAGFDANSGYGYAVGRNLNSTIGRANTECSSRSGTFCDDEGYCALRPGLWGAWASDQKYFGARGLACNFKTEDEARDRALLWCGGGCRVLWFGAGQ